MNISAAVLAISAWLSLIIPSASAAGVGWQVTAAIAYVESRGDPGVVSPCGAVGLMGVVPYPGGPTEAELLDPATNIAEGTRRLRLAMDATRGDMRRALIQYHLGYTGAERAGWLDSQDGQAYLNAFVGGWRVLFLGQLLPWEARPRRGEREEF